MIDLFKLSGDFPHLSEVRNLPPLERVRVLEKHFAHDIDDPRFIPYLQLHEFEALILVGLAELEHQHPNRRRDIKELCERLARESSDPEEVDGLRPPSYRIKEVIPEYNKRVDGLATAERIGLPRLRERCRHFGEWLSRLESIHRQPV